MIRVLIVALGLFLGGTIASHADLAQDNLIDRLTSHYESVLRKAGSDSAKKNQITAIYTRAVRTIRSKPGASGINDATKAGREMSDIVD